MPWAMSRPMLRCVEFIDGSSVIGWFSATCGTIPSLLKVRGGVVPRGAHSGGVTPDKADLYKPTETDVLQRGPMGTDETYHKPTWLSSWQNKLLVKQCLSLDKV